MATKKRKPRRIAPKKKTAKSRRRVGTSQTLKSMLTGKPPSKRLKKRRAKNTATGYYPNPVKKSLTTTIRVAYWPQSKAWAVILVRGRLTIIEGIFTTKTEAVALRHKLMGK